MVSFKPQKITPEKLASTMRPAHMESLMLGKDSFESSVQTVLFRAQRCFPSRRPMEQNLRLTHEPTNLIAEEAQLIKKHHRVQEKKFFFSRAISESMSLRGSTDTSLASKLKIDFDHYNDSENASGPVRKFSTFLVLSGTCERIRFFVWSKTLPAYL